MEIDNEWRWRRSHLSNDIAQWFHWTSHNSELVLGFIFASECLTWRTLGSSTVYVSSHSTSYSLCHDLQSRRRCRSCWHKWIVVHYYFTCCHFGDASDTFWEKKLLEPSVAQKRMKEEWCCWFLGTIWHVMEIGYDQKHLSVCLFTEPCATSTGSIFNRRAVDLNPWTSSSSLPTLIWPSPWSPPPTCDAPAGENHIAAQNGMREATNSLHFLFN